MRIMMKNKLMTTQVNTAPSANNNNQGVKSSFGKTLINAALISALTVSPVFANDYDKTKQMKAEQERSAQINEEIGFGTGVVIGAILGGPLGAFITGIAGNFIAKNINATDEIENLSIAYKTEKESKEASLARYQEQIEHTEQRYHTELLALEKNYQAASLLQAQNLLMSLQFSTGSSEIKPHYQEQIASLARIVQQSPNLTLDLSGYTDKQGSDELNQALSLARINAVKNALIDQGVTAERINLFAFGEQESVVASTDQEISFYDRRVVIQLKNTDLANDKSKRASGQTAKNY